MRSTVWKKIAMLMLVPGLALVLTACPETEEVGGGGEGVVEEGIGEEGIGEEGLGEEGLGEEGLGEEGVGLGD